MSTTKFLKPHRPKLPSSCHPVPIKGNWSLQALETSMISKNQMEACRQTINRRLNRKGQIILNTFADRGRTAKPCEVRMGKGKGKLDAYYTMVCAGQILIEVLGVPENLSRFALQGGANKLSLKTRIL